MSSDHLQYWIIYKYSDHLQWNSRVTLQDFNIFRDSRDKLNFLTKALLYKHINGCPSNKCIFDVNCYSDGGFQIFNELVEKYLHHVLSTIT